MDRLQLDVLEPAVAGVRDIRRLLLVRQIVLAPRVVLRQVRRLQAAQQEDIRPLRAVSDSTVACVTAMT